MLDSVLSSGVITAGSLAICTAASLALGLAIAGLYMFRNTYTKSFVTTLALLPVIIQVVIMLVNGNLGTGVAVMGAFSLVRFRSVPGNAREIGSIFLAMALGLATGMGYVGIAVLMLLVVGAAQLAFTLSRFGQTRQARKELKIVIPESLDYAGVFDEVLAAYTRQAELVHVKTTNMGSLFELRYQIVLKDERQEKQFLDELRCRNGNLSISCGRPVTDREML